MTTDRDIEAAACPHDPDDGGDTCCTGRDG